MADIVVSYGELRDLEHVARLLSMGEPLDALGLLLDILENLSGRAIAADAAQLSVVDRSTHTPLAGLAGSAEGTAQKKKLTKPACWWRYKK
jgi:hypothetical protein